VREWARHGRELRRTGVVCDLVLHPTIVLLSISFALAISAPQNRYRGTLKWGWLTIVLAFVLFGLAFFVTQRQLAARRAKMGAG
jgi:uncharacterized membrane protein YhaH (DUF805 family)